MRGRGQICSVPKCNRGQHARQYCNMHYRRWKSTGEVGGLAPLRNPAPDECVVSGCGKTPTAHGWCRTHYQRVIRHGDPNVLMHVREHRRGATRRIDRGYVLVKLPDHPNSAKNGWALEHRVVMADHLGRGLLPEETVHHENGVKNDNRLSNLELWSSRHPKGQRVQDLVEWAKEILALYEEVNLAPRTGRADR